MGRAQLRPLFRDAKFVYPPGLTEPRISSCEGEGLAAPDRLRATGIGGPCRLYRKLTEGLERTNFVQALPTAPERLALHLVTDLCTRARLGVWMSHVPFSPPR